jgi:membrane protein YdbS with pleckstrin-like domain
VATLAGAHQSEANESAIRLEYALTAAERSEAKSLIERHRLGGGSKWLAAMVKLLIVVGALLGFWFRIQAEFPKSVQPYVIGAIVALVVTVPAVSRLRRKRIESAETVKVDLLASGMRFLDDRSQALILWTALSPRQIESDAFFIVSDRTKVLNYIFPKRAFPSAESMDWFRTISLGQVEPAPGGADTTERVPLLPTDEPAIAVIESRLSFWNWVDKSAASWSSARGVVVLWMTMVLGVGILGFFEAPPPNAKHTEWRHFAISSFRRRFSA